MLYVQKILFYASRGREPQAITLTRAFEKRFSDFDIPTQNRKMYEWAAIAARKLGRGDIASKYSAKATSARAMCPHMQGSVLGPLPETPTGPTTTELLWQDIYAQPVGRRQLRVMELLFQFITDDFRAGLVLDSEICRIFAPDSELVSMRSTDGDGAKAHPFLAKHPRSESAAFLGMLEPVLYEVWTVRFGGLSYWLRRPGSSSSPATRYMLLTMVQETRQNHCNRLRQRMRTFQNVWQAHQEAQRYLGLLATFPDAIRTTNSFHLDTQQQLLTMTCVLDILDMTHFPEASDRDILSEASFSEYLATIAEATKFWDRAGDHDQLIKSNNITACLYWEMYMKFGSVGADACLSAYENMERSYIKLRRGRLTQDRWESVLNIQALAITVQAPQVAAADYQESAMNACLEALGITRKKEFVNHQPRNEKWLKVMPSDPIALQLVLWSQRRKARAIGEILTSSMDIIWTHCNEGH